MERFVRRRTFYVQRRFLTSFIAFLFAVSIAVPALAEFLGPDRTTIKFVTVRDPDKDVWTLTNPSAPPPYSPVCQIIHTCDEHPSVGRQQALCGWVATNSGCSMAHKTEEQTITLAEATISGNLQNRGLNNGWCTSSPTLHLTANEPLPGEAIILIEGTRNGEAFACTSDTCDVPLAEGSNSFSFWALSSYGDGSQMGNQSAQVDTLPLNSTFGSPPEGSSVWVSGVLNMSGSSSDASSGVAGAEISLDGGSTWQGLSLSGGGWAYSWDTSSLPDGSYKVFVRASDVAGHLESTAGITVHVDHTPPSGGLPDEWFIWEPVAIGAAYGGGGVDSVELTIHGGSYGVRKYTWSGGNVPNSFIWDRFFSSIVAPIGKYKVTLEVKDALGNSNSDSGRIVIPAPPTPEPEPTSSPPTDLPPIDSPQMSTPIATEESESASVIIVSTATSEPAVVGSSTGSGGGPAAAPADDSILPGGFSDPGATSPSGGASAGLLWGSAALAAAAAATAYALSRRKARELEIERMRQQVAAESSPGAFESRLNRLRAAATAAIAPARNAYLGALAAAVTASVAVADVLSRTDPANGSAPLAIEGEESIENPHLGSEPDAGQIPIRPHTEPDYNAYLIDDLGMRLPGFKLIPHATRSPLITFLTTELGVHSLFSPGVAANPTTAMTSEGFHLDFLSPISISGGWQNGRLGISIETPPIREIIGTYGSRFSNKHSVTAVFTSGGWNSLLEVSYSSKDFVGTSSETPGLSASGSQGFYYTNKPVQGAAILVGAVVIVGAAVFFGPQGVDALRTWGQQLPIPLLQP